MWLLKRRAPIIHISAAVISEVRPNDVLVITCPERWTIEEAIRFRDAVKRLLPEGSKVLLLGAMQSIRVIRETRIAGDDASRLEGIAAHAPDMEDRPNDPQSSWPWSWLSVEEARKMEGFPLCAMHHEAMRRKVMQNPRVTFRFLLSRLWQRLRHRGSKGSGDDSLAEPLPFRWEFVEDRARGEEGRDGSHRCPRNRASDDRHSNSRGTPGRGANDQ